MSSTALDVIALLCATGGAGFGAVAWLRARTAASVLTVGSSLETPRTPLRSLVAPLAERLRPTTHADLERLITSLQQAGRRHRIEVDRFLEERIFSLLIGVLGGFIVAAIVTGGLGVLLMCVFLYLGLAGPERLLVMRATERREAVAIGMPAAVDLLVTCLDAGLSPEQSIGRVAKDLAHSSPILAEELSIVASEFDAGVALPDALRRLARRVNLDDLSALCGVVAQAHGLGAPIAQTLREYAISSRRMRLSALEERAGALATQLTLPLAIFLLPAAMLTIMGPVCVQIYRAFSNGI
ncbi:MAG: type II secretion system F family protein [Myxococcales bacterium]|nr:type II secretion system F family protein [Myxococcales bacterium]